MITSFDVGNDVEIKLIGHIIGYSKSENGGDCYTIEVCEKLNPGREVRYTRIYLSEEDMVAVGAKKVERL